MSFLNKFSIKDIILSSKEAYQKELKNNGVGSQIGKSLFKLLVTKVLNCFSEKASSWPLKVKTIMFSITSRFPLKETVNFLKSSMI